MEFLTSDSFTLIALAIILWTLPWKGFALWKAAQNKHKYWFVALLLINTLGLLEIFYIFVVNRKNKNVAESPS